MGQTSRQHDGIVKGIAYRPRSREPMTETAECSVAVGRGLTAEDRPAGQREVTLMSIESWRDVCRELQVDLPWHTRRANLLTEGSDLAETIGHTLSIGGVRIEIHGESKPCGLMDELHGGLRQALVPHARGGVYGQVLLGGIIRIGDGIMIE